MNKHLFIIIVYSATAVIDVENECAELEMKTSKYTSSINDEREMEAERKNRENSIHRKRQKDRQRKELEKVFLTNKNDN